jgi:hypothetical protein
MADWSPSLQNAHAGPTGAIGCTRETSSLILALKVSKKLLTNTRSGNETGVASSQSMAKGPYHAGQS